MQVRFSSLSRISLRVIVAATLLCLALHYYFPHGNERCLPSSISDVPIISVVVRTPPESYIFQTAAVVHCVAQCAIAVGFKEFVGNYAMRYILFCAHLVAYVLLLITAVVPTGRLVEREAYYDWEDPVHAAAATLWFSLAGFCNTCYVWSKHRRVGWRSTWADWLKLALAILAMTVFGFSRAKTKQVYSCEWIAAALLLSLSHSVVMSELHGRTLVLAAV